MSNVCVKKYKLIGRIYSLSGPDGIPFYVGCTTSAMELRLRQHIAESLSNWQLSAKKIKIREFNYDITATILQIKKVRGNSKYELNRDMRTEELAWINKFLSQGIELTNIEAIRRKQVPVSEEKVGTQIRSSIPKRAKNQLKIA